MFLSTAFQLSITRLSTVSKLFSMTCSFTCQESSRLDLEIAKRPFWSSNQVAVCYYPSSHSKVEAIPLSALPKDTTSEHSGVSLH